MPIEIRITGEPEELAQLLRSWGPEPPSSLRAAIELAIANAPPVAEDAADDRAPVAVRESPSAGPPVRLPARPPDQWREEEMTAVVMEASIAGPDFPGIARATLLAMGAQRLADLSRSRYADFVEAMGEASPTLRAALEQAPWRRRKP